MKIIDAILGQLGQNSTWRGLILIGTALFLKLDPALNVDPEIQNQILAAGLGLVGLINVIRKGK